MTARSIGPSLPQAALRWLPGKVWLWHSRRNAAYVIELIRHEPALRAALRTGRLLLDLFDPAKYGSLRTENVSEPLSEKALYHGDFWYQRLVTSKSTWEKINSTWAILFQVDTMICSPPPMDVIRSASFVGGLSGFYAIGKKGEHARFKVPADPHTNTTRSHLNGGFSVHHVGWSVDCINRNPRFFHIEDALWNKCRNEIPSVNVSQVNAYRFASDNGITMCYNDPAGKRQCPFGVHKPWKKASKEALAELQAVCPGLELIQTQQFEDLDACPAAHTAGYT